ncbi:uncharacterized protein LOC100907960 [Galendromus occidentalis]|uniref:Uncharacterized protein LOC100907960 n=1 Tax=Galendromus occidentalis TaxID=34638 RepID=A0AAJ6QXF6_9ACAR|nr:uncharacterized protein LOC100907960 [Galendromus occidentalis]
MRVFVVLFSVSVLGDEATEIPKSVRAKYKECREMALTLSGREPTVFPWENPTNENIIDLSWTYDANTIYWNETDAFELRISTTGTTSKDYEQKDHVSMATSGGTHVGAPRMFHPKRWSVDQIPLRRLFNIPTVIIDVKKKVVKDRSYYLSVRDLQLWENAHGLLPNHSLIIIRTGHHMLYGNREGYFGHAANRSRVFPTMGAKAARWLVRNRNIVGVGIDSPSVDNLTTFLGHRALAKRNAYVIKNLASHIDQAPKRGTFAFVFPMKIGGASAAPARVLLRVPHSRPKSTTPNPAIS